MTTRFQRLLTLVAVCALACTALSLGSVTSAQGGEELPALQKAVEALSRALNTPITIIDSYAVERQTFPDSALGCAAQVSPVTPQPVEGYKFTVVYQGKPYDIRTSLTGDQVVLCAGLAPAKVSMALAIYRTPEFSAAYPESWNVIPRTTDIFFGPGPRPACADPGMLVASAGTRITKTLDQLLDEYANTVDTAIFTEERTDIGTVGRRATYSARCTDGSIRLAMVGMYVSQGRGYRVVVYAPQADFLAWTDMFNQMLGRFSAASVGPNNGQPVTLPTSSPLALIAHIFAGQVYAATLVDFPGQPITSGMPETHQYRDVMVSPLGTQLAFVDDADGKLWIASPQGGTPLAVGDSVAAGYPPAWSPDGREIAYLRTDGALNAARADGAGTRKIGQVTVKTASLPGMSPAERLYIAETGISGNRVLLAWVKDGSLCFSLGADGIGVGRLDPTGAVTTISDSLRRVSLSPDGREALGVIMLNGQDTAARLTLSDGALTPVTLAAVPDQLAWSADGKQIVSAVLAPKTELKLDDSTEQERVTTVFGSFPVLSAVYNIQVRALDVASGATVDLYRGEGRGIGRLLPSPDSSGLLFSLVQSDALLIESFKNNVNGIELRRQFPTVQLYWLGRGQKQPLLLAITTSAAWGQLGSAPAPTPTGGFKTPARRLTLTPIPSATPLPPTNTPERRVPPPTNTPRG